MAERVRLEIPTGGREVRRAEWDESKEGGLASLGTLDWTVVVLEELTVELEVSVEIAPLEDQNEPTVVLLQEATRGRNFRGTVDPSGDERLSSCLQWHNGDADVDCSRIQAVLFEFSNEFSWLTGKSVEFFILRHKPQGPPLSRVPPLRALEPVQAVPRSPGNRNVVECHFPPSLLARSGETDDSNNAARTDNDAGSDVLRFTSNLDQCLAAAEFARPAEGSRGEEVLREVLEQLGTLRSMCNQARKDSGSEFATVPTHQVKKARQESGLSDCVSGGLTETLKVLDRRESGSDPCGGSGVTAEGVDQDDRKNGEARKKSGLSDCVSGGLTETPKVLDGRESGSDPSEGSGVTAEGVDQDDRKNGEDRTA